VCLHFSIESQAIVAGQNVQIFEFLNFGEEKEPDRKKIITNGVFVVKKIKILRQHVHSFTTSHNLGKKTKTKTKNLSSHTQTTQTKNPLPQNPNDSTRHHVIIPCHSHQTRFQAMVFLAQTIATFVARASSTIDG
jgi:hypothetical protein